jgi:uncharacterized membrane protein YqjE
LLSRSYYYNIETRQSQQEHPNMKKVGAAIVAELNKHKAKLQVMMMMMMMMMMVVVVVVVVVVMMMMMMVVVVVWPEHHLHSNFHVF